jgi:transcriptional regulator of nitric oxide reductase
MKLPIVVVTCVFAAVVVVSGQAALDSKTQAQLKSLFPQASGFSAKGADLPVIKAYSGDPKAASPSVIGYAFYTTEMQPLERAYDGPIKWLVGMDTRGVLTGAILVEHKEPYGNFSIETGAFQSHFKNKDIRDAFKIGADIDAISRATVSVGSSARAIRNSARRVARALLTPPGESR